MPVSRSPIGQCPRCGTTIPGEGLLIEYDATGGRSRYAACPGCGDVVHPEAGD